MVHTKKRGFTLIESIVVVGVIALVLPALFSIIFVILRQQAKIIRLYEIKKQGDAVLSKFESSMKDNAVSIHFNAEPPAGRVCDRPDNNISGTALYFADKEPNQWFGYYYEAVNRKIVYTLRDNPAADPRDIDMTNSKVMVSNFNIGCSLNFSYAQPLVNLSFDICYRNDIIGGTNDDPCASSQGEEIASMHYSASVRLRNQAFTNPPPPPN